MYCTTLVLESVLRIRRTNGSYYLFKINRRVTVPTENLYEIVRTIASKFLIFFVIFTNRMYYSTKTVTIAALKLLDGGGKGGKGGSKYREVVWDIHQRGAMGENLLHVCLLQGTALHNALAIKLIHTFPKLVNDIFLSEDYYGGFYCKN